MNVISHTRPVSGWIIISKHIDVIAFPSRNLKHDRYQMGFRIVQLTTAPGGTRRIEVAQRNRAYSVSALVPRQRLLKG
jgi:hypothetical protein